MVEINLKSFINGYITGAAACGVLFVITEMASATTKELMLVGLYLFNTTAFLFWLTNRLIDSSLEVEV